MSSKDIYSILSSKYHNPHYLNRYWKFISSLYDQQLSKLAYTENHHICPKAKDLFPEYKSFSVNPWNKIKLTGRQHLLAHLMLAKAYPNSNIVFGLNRIISSSNFRDKSIKLTSRLYESIRIEIAKKSSENTKSYISKHGHPRGMLGKKHSEYTKQTYFSNKFGENNSMYGKTRPDLVYSNKDPILAAKRGKSSSLKKLETKLSRFNSNSAGELILKIEFQLSDQLNYNTTGRYPNTPNFGRIAKILSKNYHKTDKIALKRFYEKYKTESSSVNSSTLI